MDIFLKASVVRLKGAHGKYLTADDDEESVTQDREGSAKSAKWSVEFVNNADNVIRLRSCYGKYLTASNQPFLLGMTGRKVLQTLPKRLDSSVEWEPILAKGGAVKLKTRYGQFLRANGGLPPWRNSVTHDIPHRTATQEWILWDVDVVDILMSRSPLGKPPPPLPVEIKEDSFSSAENSPIVALNHSRKSSSFARFLSNNDSFKRSPPKRTDGRLIYFRIADEKGEIDEGYEELCFTFKGNGVDALKMSLEEELGVQGITVCTRSPLDGKLHPLLLHLPPNNATMHVVVVPPSSTQDDDSDYS